MQPALRPLHADHQDDHGRGNATLRAGQQRVRAGLTSCSTFCDIANRTELHQLKTTGTPASVAPSQAGRAVMKGEAKVVEYLNKALRHELTAVNQYWLHYRLLENWGYQALAKKWRKESIEEMEHADKLVHRIIFLDGFPNMQVLDPLHIGQTVKEVLECDLQAEISARTLYEEAATHSHSVKDYVTRDLFEKLMSDEESHIDFLETQLDLVARLGLELYAQHHIGELEDD
jgi:bacterioferritin